MRQGRWGGRDHAAARATKGARLAHNWRFYAAIIVSAQGKGSGLQLCEKDGGGVRSDKKSRHDFGYNVGPSGLGNSFPQSAGLAYNSAWLNPIGSGCSAVASALRSGRRGRWFESTHPDQVSCLKTRSSLSPPLAGPHQCTWLRMGSNCPGNEASPG